VEFLADNNVLIILDVAIHPELEKDGLAREISVQRLRKKPGLVPTDDVGVESRVLADPDKISLEEVFKTHSAVIRKVLSRTVGKQIVEGVEGKEIIIEEDHKVRKATFSLRLVKL
jgi:isoleucyl-tRNA synthetase